MSVAGIFVGFSAEMSCLTRLCLDLLSVDYGRTLPPLDWLSLEAFLDREELRPGFVATISLLGALSRFMMILFILQHKIGVNIFFCRLFQ